MNTTNAFFPCHHSGEFNNETILDLLERYGDEICAILEIAASSPTVDGLAVITAAFERSDEAATRILYALTDLHMTYDGLVTEEVGAVYLEASRETRMVGDARSSL